MHKRNRDDGRHISTFLGAIDVVCPRCAGHATIRTPILNLASDRRSPARLACPRCGLVRTQALPRLVLSSYVLDRNGRDPYFGLPLWLTTPTRHGTLWAFNAEHLAALQTYIGARLRERNAHPACFNRNATMASRLPHWMKRARNRDEVMKGLAQLREKLR